jgi:UDP-3-O-acyl N-acetylglucosamine deacetylase
MDPGAAIVMMSGHGTAPTAVKSIKMGAFDYLEKPLSYDQAIGAVEGALSERASRTENQQGSVLDSHRDHDDLPRALPPLPELSLLQTSEQPQRTISAASVVYGLGLHSGSQTGMVMQPLPVDTGIHFVTLPAGQTIPARIDSVADTDYATSVVSKGETIRTVEHLLSALHAYGITNLLVKVHGEIPVLDGSALEFCRKLEDIGIVDQEAPRREIVIDRRYEVGGGREKSLVIEPSENFRVSYLLRYPEPVGEQFYEYEHRGAESFKEKIAPARTFGFMRDLKMINELGLGSGGRLDNFILVGEDNVINTELRFPDEFVRHKILDIIGDLYLLGYPIRGKITARLTGHRDNIDLQRKILSEIS